MRRISSYVFPAQFEQGPTHIMENNLNAHRTLPRRYSQSKFWGSGSSLSRLEKVKQDTIRFQIIVWAIETPDVARSRVSMKFRVTLFWNRAVDIQESSEDEITENGVNEEASIVSNKSNTTKSSRGGFVMDGRGKAKAETIQTDNDLLHIDVPPLSIINAESFSVVGKPDIACLRESDGLMRWTCLYKATLRQNDMMVTNFPHDRHALCIQLGILKDRHSGGIWDRRKWKLALATPDDSRGSTRVPHGLVVDNVRIPEFTIEEDGTSFEFAPVPYGPATNVGHTTEECLEVKVKVFQESGYYDSNIIPVLIIITICAMFLVGCQGVEEFFERGLLLLNCAFVQVGLRMNIDNRLPRVQYQIKIQRVMNSFFFLIFYLVVESGINFTFVRFKIWSIYVANIIDILTVVTSAAFTIYLTFDYFDQLKVRAKTIADEFLGASNVI